MVVRNFLNVVVLVSVWLSSVNAKSEYPKILIVSMDGFKPDYIDDCLTPTMFKLRSTGVYAPYLRPVFPTRTFTNHHSVATGVFPEVHGVLDSTVYDFKDGCCSNRSLIKYSYELFHYNNDILPLWTLNQLAGKGRHSGVMMWPGSEFPYGCKKTKPTFSQKYLRNITNEDRVDTVMSWFTHEATPANLVMMYFDQPDFDAHAYGIDSLEVRDQVKKMDKTLDYILQQLKKHHLEEHVTVFVLSDHGGLSINQNNIIDISQYVNNASYVKAGYSPVWQIFPNEGKEWEVLSGFQRAHADHKNKFAIYAREDIPRIWHWASNNRTPPLLVLANEGYAFQDFYDIIDETNRVNHIEPNPRNKYGLHGYMNTYPSMYGIFFAWGPLLKSGVVLDPFNNTELYPLWASILKLELEHEVYFRPNFSMLHSGEPLNLVTVKPNLIAQVPGNLTGGLPKVGAPLWTYWFAGLIAVTLVIIIAGVVTLFGKSLFNQTAEPVLPQMQRNEVENQHLLVSESEDELKL